MAPKKIFLGSLFQFLKPAEAITEFEESFPDSSIAPFIIYDKGNQLFSYEESESNDATSRMPLIRQLSAYIERHGHEQSSPLDPPRLRPIDGTSLQELRKPVRKLQMDQDLLDYDTSSSDDLEGFSTDDQETNYWKPNDSDITILTEDCVTTIANTTGCWVFPDAAHQRVRLVGGDTRAAQEKLNNLEPVLNLIAKHQRQCPRRLDANVVVLRNDGTDSRVKFVPLIHPHAGVDRILLAPHLKHLIHKVLVVEARFRRDDDTEFRKPVNLDLEGVALLEQKGPSRVFDLIEMPRIGNENQATPTLFTKQDSQAAPRPEEASGRARFLGPSAAARVSEWSKAIVPGADPEICPPIPQPEKLPKARRRIVEESESDGEDDAAKQADAKPSMTSLEAQVNNQLTQGHVAGKSHLVEHSLSRSRSGQDDSEPRQIPSRASDQSSVLRGRRRQRDEHKVIDSKHGLEENVSPTSPQNLLIDVSDPGDQTGPPIPPPGYDYRSGAALYQIENHFKHSPSTSTSPSSRQELSNHSPRQVTKKRDVELIRRERLAQLLQDHHTSVVGMETAARVKAQSKSPPRKYEEDSKSDIKYHRTMGQKAPKPMTPKKGGQSPEKRESKKEREARIAKAIAEAYGGPPLITTSNSPFTNIREHDAGNGATSVRKANAPQASPQAFQVTAEVKSQQMLSDQVRKLSAELGPLFEACRAFAGKVRFEMQFGQALVLANESLKAHILRRAKDWAKLFHKEHLPVNETLFTNMVTTNGLEIDRLLQMKGFDKKALLWSEIAENSNTVFEFWCYDRTGQHFTVQLRHDTSYKILRGHIVIGKVALCCADQIWDTCAVLEGGDVWDNAPEEVVAGVRQLMHNLHIPAMTVAVVDFRQPGNNSFWIRGVTVRKSIIRSCLEKDYDDCKLSVTEVKQLVHSSHPADKKLFRSTELDFNAMVDTGRLHYEISVCSESINAALDQHNSNLQLGNLTPADVAGKALLSYDRMLKLVKVSTYMIERSDWLGAGNYGTCRQALDMAIRARSLIQEIIPPQIPTLLHQGIRLASGQTLDSTTVPSMSFNLNQPAAPGSSIIVTVPQVLKPIPGPRAATTASVWQQGGGLFRHGIGGAHVPVPLLNVDKAVTPGNSTIGKRGHWNGSGQGSSDESDTEKKPPGFW